MFQTNKYYEPKIWKPSKKQESVNEPNIKDYENTVFSATQLLLTMPDSQTISYVQRYQRNSVKLLDNRLQIFGVQKRFDYFGTTEGGYMGEISHKYIDIIKDFYCPSNYKRQITSEYLKKHRYYKYFKERGFTSSIVKIYYDYVKPGNSTDYYTIGRLKLNFTDTAYHHGFIDEIYFYIDGQEHSLGGHANIYLSEDLFDLLRYGVDQKHVLNIMKDCSKYLYKNL